MSTFKRLPIHPILFAIYPATALLAANLKEAEPSSALRSLLISLALVSIAWLFFHAILREWRRSAILATLLAILFFSYGHVYTTLEQSPIFSVSLGRHRLLLPLWILLALFAAWWSIRRVRDAAGATALLNLAGIVLLVLPVARMALFEIRLATAETAAPGDRAEASGLRLENGTGAPDIYYIILDTYPRQDVLREQFGFDNGPFLAELRKLGFFVAECSQSNYAQTILSLASSLNMDYLQSLDEYRLQKLLSASRARALFAEQGYTTVAFETGFAWSQMKDADYYFAPEERSRGNRALLGKINAFEAMLVRTTAFLAVEDAAANLPRRFLAPLTGPGERHRDRVLFVFDRLSRIHTEIEGPKFVFAHIVSPHPPFVFGPNGETVYTADNVDDGTYQQAYLNQVGYLNKRVLALIGDLLSRSERPPVILLQADHGHTRASGRERMAILNAYFLPGDGGRSLYPSISPVNSFRVVFNAYFGGRFPLLPDTSYYSSYKDPYHFEVIPESSPACSGN